MYKLVGEERFLLWAVCSIQLQVLPAFSVVCCPVKLCFHVMLGTTSKTGRWYWDHIISNIAPPHNCLFLKRKILGSARLIYCVSYNLFIQLVFVNKILFPVY